MELSKQKKTIKYTVYALLLAVAALVQNVGGLWFEIGGARCFFLLPVTVLLSLGEDERTAALLGLFAGVLWDAVSVQHMGFNAIFLMVMCYFCAAMVNFVFRDTYWVSAIGATVVSLLYCLLYWLIIVLPKGSEGSVLSLARFYLPCFLYTGAACFILPLVIRPLKRKLNGVAQEA